MISSECDQSFTRYQLLTKIASGDLIESWLALDSRLDRYVFLKRPIAGPGSQLELAREKLQCSHEVLSKLRHPHILPPTDFHDSKSTTFITFPCVSDSRRFELTTAAFRKIYHSLLPRICHVIDFVHCMGFVHCDIKLENFLLIGDLNEYRLLLTDFDLVMESGSQLDKRIIGTPSHIAPEILRNEAILPQSDHFSLGIMLSELLRRATSTNDKTLAEVLEQGLSEISLSVEDVEAEFTPLMPFVNSLLKLNAQERPTYLGEALKNLSLDDTTNKEIADYDTLLIEAVFRAKYRLLSLSGNRDDRSLLASVIDNMKVIGIPDEIIRDAGGGLKKGPHPVARSLRELLKSSEVSRVGDYWHIKPAKSAISKFYQAAWLPENFREMFADQNVDNWRQKLLHAIRLKVRGEFLKALLLMEDLLSFIPHQLKDQGTELEALLYTKAGELCRACGRAEAAERHYRKALALDSLPVVKRVLILCNLADMNRKERKGSSYQKTLRAASQIARQHNLLRYRLIILHKRLWMYYVRGENIRALRHLEVIGNFAHSKGYVDIYFRIRNLVGLIYRDLGRLEAARNAFRDGINCLEVTATLKRPVALYNNLAYTYFDLGDYSKCIESAKTALELNTRATDISMNTFAYFALASCYTISAHYDLADRYFTKLLAAETGAAHVAGIAICHIQRGWSNLRRSNYGAAQVDLSNALRMSTVFERQGYRAKIMLYLAMLDYQRGNHRDAMSVAEIAHDLLKQVGDQVFAADARLLMLQISTPELRTLDARSVVEILDEFLGWDNYLGAIKCLFWLTVSGGEKEAIICLDRHAILQDRLSTDDSPFNTATKCLLDYWRLAGEQQESEATSSLKQSYVILRRASLLFEAIAVCTLIARNYIGNRRLRLAAKFLGETLFLARRIGNPVVSRSLERQLTSLEQEDNDNTTKLRSLYEISSLLNSLTEYKDVQAKILKYAIDATGAERGVLMVADDFGKTLHVEAYYECDDQSISDVKSISENVIHSVYKDGKPYLVADATKDEFTQNYRSIIRHNILSIACISLQARGRIMGVLYLDHHVLPGLFTADDYEMIEAIGNFAAIALEQARHMRRLEAENVETNRVLQAYGIKCPFITQNHRVIDLLEKLPLIADSESSVLIVGESGTGKELLADLLQQQGGRSTAPFVKLNCAVLEGSMLESELFGVEKGVATGVSQREGKFEAADGGTILLDEIGELPLSTQAKLLRVLENQEFERLGSNKLIEVDIRLISATNQNLRELISKKKFREDLFYRINTVELRIPPLRERTDDIMILIEYFLSLFGTKGRYTFTPEAKALLISYSWPGNVRELRNLVERVTILTSPGVIGVDNLSREISDSQKEHGLKKIRYRAQEAEKSEIERSLHELNWNQSAVARHLKMSLSTLRRRIKNYNIERES